MRIALTLALLMATLSTAHAVTPTTACGVGEALMAIETAHGAINPDAYERLQTALQKSEGGMIRAMAERGEVWQIPARSIVCLLRQDHLNYRVQVAMGTVPVPVWVRDSSFAPIQ